MSGLMIIVAVCVGGMLGLLVWSTAKKDRSAKSAAPCLDLDFGTLNLANFPQIQQALALADIEFVEQRCGRKRAKLLREERRRVVLGYLDKIKEDFERLSAAATAIATLAPQVNAKEEWRRIRLGLEFQFKYQLLRAKFQFATPPAEQLGRLVWVASCLAVNIEQAMSKIAAEASAGTYPTQSVQD